VPESIWLGQFNIVGGQVQEEGPYAAHLTGRSVADSIANLYTAIQPTSEDTEQLCAEVQQTIGRMFGRAQYSVTGNLLLALGKAHQHLRDWNRSSLPDHRMGIGISCLAIAGDEAYLAQAGPSTAFYRHNGRMELLQPLEPEAQAALGTADSLSPWFQRLELEQGDTLLLLTGNFGIRADPDLIEQYLTQDPESALAGLYRYARAERDCGALLLAVTEAVGPAGRTVTESRGAQAGEPFVLERNDDRGRKRQQPGGTGKLDPDRPLREPPLGPGGPRRSPSPLGRSPFRRVNAVHPDEGAGVVRIMGAERPRQRFGGPAHALATPDAALAAATNIPRSSVRMRSGLPSFRARFPGLGGRRRGVAPLLAGGIGVVAAIALLWLGIPALIASGRSQRFSTLVRSAQTQLSTAQSENDLSKRRELLNQALTNIDEARRLRPADTRAMGEATSVSDALTTLDAVYALPDVPELANLSAAGLSPSSTVEVAAGDRLYVLDFAAGKVFATARNSSPLPAAVSEVVYEDGSSIDGVQAGKAHHIVWQPSTGPGDSGTLYILDSARHLFGLSRNDLRAVPLRGVEQWRSDTAMALSGGVLYLLDAAGGLVWRYGAAGNGFDTDPAPALARADIRDAGGISVVGGIFLTGQDARIRRFLDGQEGPFKLAGIDRAPTAPQPPLFDPATGWLYIADRGNGRIIVLEGDGRFKRQLVNARLAGLRSATIDSGESRLVGVIGQSLVAIPLPRSSQ